MKRGRIALIDADIVAYAAAAAGETKVDFGDGAPIASVGEMDDACEHAVENINKLQVAVDAAEVLLTFSCSRADGFRRDILPSYKGHRSVDPALREPVKKWLRDWFTVIERPKLEGDDLLGILATKPNLDGWPTGRRVIVSVDKDLLQIPGRIYNPRKETEVTVTPAEGDYLHMMQTLTGDPADGYKGIPGIGPKRAARILADGTTDCPIWECVTNAYAAANLTEADALVQARVARILRHGEFDYRTKQPILWSPPQ